MTVEELVQDIRDKEDILKKIEADKKYCYSEIEKIKVSQ